MNKFSIFIFIVFACLFTNCQKEKFCTEGFTGPNCDQEIPPLRISIDGIRINRFPDRKSNGNQWDIITSTYPDIYIKLYNEREKVDMLKLDYYKKDVASSVIFTEPVTFDYPSQDYVIELWDYDDFLDDKMPGMIFKPHQNGLGFPSTISLKTADLEIELIGAKYNF